MELSFEKYEGLGNDFLVVDDPQTVPAIDAALAMRLCDRHRGVGGDGVLMTGLRGDRPFMRVFNADGSVPEMCGNGLRCVALHLVHRGLARARDPFVVDTDAGEHRVIVHDAEGREGRVEVAMRPASLEPRELPLRSEHRWVNEPIEVAGRLVRVTAVSMGNPHAVLLVDSVDDADVGILGAALETHPDFPRGVNVGFLEIVRPDRVRLRVFERGVGETPACGTGAAAAVAVGRRWGALDEEVDVELRGGVLTVRWPGPGQPLWQTGPTTLVYEGVIEL